MVAEDYVLEVSNPAGFVQIDSILKNYKVLASGTVPASAMDSSLEAPIFFPAQPVPPLIMYRPAVYGADVRQHRAGLSSAYVSAAVPSSHVDLHYVVLVPMQDEPADDDVYVLNVWDADERLVFSSSERYIGIDALVNSPAPFPEGNAGRLVNLPVPAFGLRYFTVSSEYVWNGSFTVQFGVSLVSETQIRIGGLGYLGTIRPVDNPLVQVLTGYFQP